MYTTYAFEIEHFYLKKIHSVIKLIVVFFFNDVKMPRVRFVPSHVTREPLAQIVIQPVAAITTRPVTPRLARVTVQLGTSAKSRSLWTAFFIHIHVYSTWKVIIQQFIKNLS